MPKIIDTKRLPGERHGMLTIESVNHYETRIRRTLMVNVVCDCGTKKTITLANFRRGAKSCGCLLREHHSKRSRYIEYEGERHTVAEWARILGVNVDTIRTRLHKGLPTEEVLKTSRRIKVRSPLDIIAGKRFGRLLVLDEFTANGRRRLHVKCECGTIFETDRYRVLSGTCKSCGCYRADMLRERNSVVKYVIDGEEHTVKEWADKMGITDRTFYNRMRTHRIKGRSERRVYFGDRLITQQILHRW